MSKKITPEEPMTIKEIKAREAAMVYSDDAEKAIIGCMISQPREVIEEAIDLPLRQDDFFVAANQIMYGLLCKMWEDGEAIEMMVIHQRLEDWKEGGSSMADRLGSPGILAEYSVSFASHLNVGSYFRIVKDKSFLRKMKAATEGIQKDISEMPDSVASVVERAESAISAVIDENIIHTEANFGMEIQEAALSIFEHADAGGGLRGLRTGFKKMDELTMGWIKGDLIIVAARPGKGKTGLMLAFIKTLVEDQFNIENGHYDIDGEAVQIFSAEMRRHELYMRLYSMKAGVGLQNILTGALSELARGKITTAQNEMARWPIKIDDTSNMDVDLLRARARRAVRKHGVKAIFVDYLQLLKSRKYPKDRQNEVAYVSRTLKHIAMENDVPVIALAQLNRKDAGDDDIEPHIANIRDSGAIEQDADKIILLHEDKNADRVIKANDNLKHYRAILAKHRNGKQGRVELDFEAWKVLFTEYEKV